MKTLSKLLVLLVLICLLVMSAASALAQSIPDQVQSPEHVTGTYTSPSGRTTVSLDAQVVVPQVEAMPIVEVFPRLFEAAEVRAFADLMIGEGAWEAWYYSQLGMEAKQEQDPDPQPGYHLNQFPTVDDHAMYLQSKDKNEKGYATSKVSATYIIMHSNKDKVQYHSLDYSLNTCRNQGRDIGSLEAARDLADAVVGRMFPDMVFFAADPEHADLPDRCLGQNGQGDYGHRLYYVRKHAGIPVTHVYQQGASGIMDQYGYEIPYEKLFVDVGEKGIFQIRYKNPLTVGDTLQTSTRLLPFSQVLEVFARLAPLKYASAESEENNGIQIHQVVLGYMVLQMRDQPARYQLVPVWDFMGSRTIGQERYDFFQYPHLTINALDGTVIDRDLGY